MNYLLRKFLAFLIAVWLPLFSGNALATSIGMQFMGGDCLTTHVDAVQHSVEPSFHNERVPSMQHAHLVAQNEHQGEHKNTPHKSCNICHLACCGYMAVSTSNVAAATSLADLFVPSPESFQSITSAPLNPPPLARV